MVDRRNYDAVLMDIQMPEMDGYEADDVLGSVAKIAAEKGLGVKIITGDLRIGLKEGLVEYQGRRDAEAAKLPVGEVFGHVLDSLKLG